MSLVKVQGNPNLFRDTNNQALINTDRNGLDEYNRKRKMLAAQKEELNIMKAEIQSINNDICEIKELMYKLLNKG